MLEVDVNKFQNSHRHLRAASLLLPGLKRDPIPKESIHLLVITAMVQIVKFHTSFSAKRGKKISHLDGYYFSPALARGGDSLMREWPNHLCLLIGSAAPITHLFTAAKHATPSLVSHQPLTSAVLK